MATNRKENPVMRTVLETIQSSSNGAACGIIAEDRPRCVCANTVACPVWLSQLSGLPPLKLLQVEPDVAQQHPRYRAHDRNWFSLMDAPQPRIFVEFDLDKGSLSSMYVRLLAKEMGENSFAAGRPPTMAQEEL